MKTRIMPANKAGETGSGFVAVNEAGDIIAKGKDAAAVLAVIKGHAK